MNVVQACVLGVLLALRLKLKVASLNGVGRRTVSAPWWRGLDESWPLRVGRCPAAGLTRLSLPRTAGWREESGYEVPGMESRPLAGGAPPTQATGCCASRRVSIG
jgi:hypothetical protein